jgi:tetratricopeptide (TPR) repeat protein
MERQKEQHSGATDENPSVHNIVETKVARESESLSKSATKIQAMHRGRKSRVEVQELKEQTAAVKKIQAIQRGNVARNKIANVKKAGNPPNFNAVTNRQLTSEHIERQFRILTKQPEISDTERFNRQFPKGIRVDPNILTKDLQGTKMLNNIANRLIEEKKYAYGTKYREKAVLYMGEALGWKHEKVQKAAVDMMIEKNELAMRMLSDSNNLWDQAHKILNDCEVLSKPDSNIKFNKLNRLKTRALTFNNLGCYFKKIRRNTDALHCLLKALKIEEGKIDCGNPASTHVNVCVILSAMSRHTHALEHIKSAIALLEYENSLEEDDANKKGNSLLAVAYFNKGAELEHLHKEKLAIKAYKKAQEIAVETFKPGHPLLENIQQSYKYSFNALLKRK